MEEATDIIRLIAEGDERAFRQLYDDYHQRIYSIGYYFTQNNTVAQDITQDVFLKIWEQKEQLKKIENFEGWIKILVRNHSYNIIAKAAREAAYQKQKASTIESSSISKYVEQKEQTALILQAVHKLPEQQKRVYLLNKFDGFKVAEIAKAMNLSVHTIKNHLKAASTTIHTYCQKNMKLILLISILTKYFF